MNVLLVDIDSTIPNLALMKLSAHYKQFFRNNVGFNIKNPDIIYVSCIFKKNREQAYGLKHFYPNTEIIFGGSGLNYNLLPEEIESLKPDYDLYPSTYSQGYTTRGCTKRCSFCVVPDKEGKFKRNQHIKEFHDKKHDTVMLMDNNILADKEWFFNNTDYLLENNLKLIEHGMDVHRLDEEVAQRLSMLKWAKPMKFAFDHLSDEKAVLKGIELLKDVGIDTKRKVQFYVLAGYNTTYEEDLYRCQLLKDNNTSAFVMPYHKNKKLTRLARWVNWKHFFWGSDFPTFLKGYA